MSSDQGRHFVQQLPAPLARLWRAATGDDLLQHGGIVAVATVASGGFNYAYQLFMGRALGPEQYGAFGALFALFYLVNVLGRGIRFSVARFVSCFDRRASASAFHRGALSRSLLVGGIIFAALTTASVPLGDFLGVAPRMVVVVAATIPPGLAFTANQGVLEGQQRFAALGGYKILKAGLKLGLGVVFVLAGFGLYGAFGAIVTSLFVALVASTAYVGWRLRTTRTSTTGVDYRQAYRYGFPAILAGFCLTIPANADVIVVKHFFPATDAGLYTAASVLGKVLVFLPMGISTALFPKVSADHESESDGRPDALFYRALLYAGVIGGAGALAYWVAPATILSVLFGDAYVAATPILRWYGLAVLPFVLAVVVLNFQLARDRMRFVYVFATGSVVEVALVWVAHASLVQVVQIVLLTNSVIFAIGIAVVRTER